MNPIATVVVLSALLASSAHAAPVNYRIDPELSRPSFEISHLGFSTQHGRFNRAEGEVVLDFARKVGSVDFTIQVASLDTGSKAWNAHLLDEGLFNVKKHPTMNFKSSRLIFEGETVVAAEGEFTVVGVTKPLRLTVSRFHCGTNPYNKKQECGGDITATLKRSEFGLTKYIPEVSDEITIQVPVEAYKQ